MRHLIFIQRQITEINFRNNPKCPLIIQLNFTVIYPNSKEGFPGSSDGKAFACDAGDLDLIPGLGRSPEEGNGNPLQYSCLENSMDGGA